MDFFLIPPEGEKFHFPVNPEEVNIRREKQYETVNIMRLGEVDFAQREKVREITFSSFFPKEYDASYCRYPNLPDPQNAMNVLNDYLISKKPLRLLITKTHVNVLVFLSAHNSTFKGGEPDDVYFEVAFRTWTEVKVRTTAENVVNAEGGIPDSGGDRSDTKPVPPIYEVRSGDALWKIAKRELGDMNRWPEIYAANKETIGPDSNLIYPGQKLVIPK